MPRTRYIILGVLLSLSMLGCTKNIQYRTDYNPCISSQPEEQCPQQAIQQYRNPAEPQTEYQLGFVEFDDQGQLHDRAQLNQLLDAIYKEAAENNLLLVVFVHGWKHNAAAGDDNVTNFRATLQRLAQLETQASQQAGRQARQVFGVYLGWRGQSLDVPYLENLTFWERKNTAHQVGHGAVAEVLARLEEVKRISVAIDEKHPPNQTRLVVIGHSFGGAVVYSALAQILKERFVETQGPATAASNVRGFGDLIVLLNPAFEAMQLANLSDMANARGSYFPGQLPVLAVLTSEADWATKYAFWAGRFFSTLFEKHKDTTRPNAVTQQPQEIAQGSANRTAIGHFAPYQTHTLSHQDMPRALDDLGMLQSVRSGWTQDAPGAQMSFPGSVLTHEHNSVGRNPYLLIKVDKKIIPGHNEIYDPRVIEFLRHFILVSTQETGEK